MDSPVTYATGIDVSHHQGVVGWDAVRTNGVAFVFIKATEGAHYVDPRFRLNWTASADSNILRGAYHFFRPAIKVSDQVDAFLSTVGTLRPTDLPPVLDLEETPGINEWLAIPTSDRLPLALQWLQAVQVQTGKRPIVYTRKGFLAQFLGPSSALSGYPLWIAHYTESPQPSIPAGWTSWTFWQHSQTGSNPGMVGAVDLDRFNGAVADLEAWIQQTNVSSPDAHSAST